MLFFQIFNMAVLRPLTRLVYFRVSEEEFEAIRNACGTDGTRTISDVARSAVRALIGQRQIGQTCSLDTVILRIDQNVDTIKQNLKAIETTLSKLAANAGTEGAGSVLNDEAEGS